MSFRIYHFKIDLKHIMIQFWVRAFRMEAFSFLFPYLVSFSLYFCQLQVYFVTKAESSIKRRNDCIEDEKTPKLIPTLVFNFPNKLNQFHSLLYNVSIHLHFPKLLKIQLTFIDISTTSPNSSITSQMCTQIHRFCSIRVSFVSRVFS